MKKRLFALFLLVFMFSISFASAYNSFSNISLSNIAENEWFNAALLFLFIFAVAWFVLQNVFKSSPGAALIISIVMAMFGSTGVIYYFGAVAKYFSWWVLAVAAAIIVVLLYKQLKKQGTVFSLIFIALALLWFLYGRTKICLDSAILPENACTILDAIASAFIIIGLIKLLLMAKSRVRGSGGGPNELSITINGNGATRPRPGIYRYGKNAKIKIRAYPKSGSAFEKWILNGKDVGTNPILKINMNASYNVIAVFGGASTTSTTTTPSTSSPAASRVFRRTASDLQHKYTYYKQLYKQEWDAYQQRAKKEGLRSGIPPNNSPEGKIRHRYLQAIKAIENMARQQRIRLK